MHGTWNWQVGISHRNKICGFCAAALASSTRSCLAAAFALGSRVVLQEPFPCVPASTRDAAAALLIGSLLSAVAAHNRSLAHGAALPVARAAERGREARDAGAGARVSTAAVCVAVGVAQKTQPIVPRHQGRGGNGARGAADRTAAKAIVLVLAALPPGKVLACDAEDAALSEGGSWVRG